MTDNQWGQLLILATTVGTFLAAEYRATRNRRWAEEDLARNAAAAIAERKAATAEIIERAAAEAEATRIKTEAIAESLRSHTERTAASLREEARIAADQLVREAAVIADKLSAETQQTIEEARATSATVLAEVKQATVAAKDAYKEANHVNLKIENLNQRLLAADEKAAQTQTTAALPTDTVAKIDNIDATTTAIAEQVIEKKPGDSQS